VAISQKLKPVPNIALQKKSSEGGTKQKKDTVMKEKTIGVQKKQNCRRRGGRESTNFVGTYPRRPD